MIRKHFDDDGESDGDFSTYLEKKLCSDFGLLNVKHLSSFLRSMLQSDPEARLPTTDLLRSPYLAAEIL